METVSYLEVVFVTGSLLEPHSLVREVPKGISLGDGGVSVHLFEHHVPGPLEDVREVLRSLLEASVSTGGCC